MDPITINRLGQIRQQDNINSAAVCGERELQPWLQSLKNMAGVVWQQTNDVADRIDATTKAPAAHQRGCEGLQS